jgi:hypothetical protein
VLFAEELVRAVKRYAAAAMLAPPLPPVRVRGCLERLGVAVAQREGFAGAFDAESAAAAAGLAGGALPVEARADDWAERSLRGVASGGSSAAGGGVGGELADRSLIPLALRCLYGAAIELALVKAGALPPAAEGVTAAAAAGGAEPTWAARQAWMVCGAALRWASAALRVPVEAVSCSR